MKNHTFLWRNPEGKIVSTTGESANQAANQLGGVLGWVDMDTVSILWRGTPHDFKLQPRGAI